jgi:hypothetical protein
MNKKDARQLFVFAVMAVMIYSCSKKSDPATPPGNKDPIQVVKRILRHKNANQIIADTFAFKYDQDGRVISKIYPGQAVHEDYAYTSGKLTAITSVSANGSTQNLNFSQYSANGDTILLDFTKPDPTAQGKDTVQLTYIFKNDIVSDFWVYLHSYNGFMHFEKNAFHYNASGNIIDKTYENLTTAPYITGTITAWDDKINPKSNQPKLNHMLLDLAVPFESHSVHNPSRYTNSQGAHEVVMTYNPEGYPLTMKLAEQDFIQNELIYNR